MNYQYLVSVIVPVYNVEKYVRKCIESIIKQTYQNLQIILIDDGSTDRSGKICEKYAGIDARIEVIHQRNSGSVKARKAGLLLAKGEYIGFVDADDYVEPDFYANMLAIIVEGNIDFVHSGYVIEKGMSREACISYKAGMYDISGSQAEFISTYIFKVNNSFHMSHNLWSKLFKADLVKSCFLQLPDDQVRGEDLLCMCLCILRSKRIFLDTMVGYHYVMREESITHKAVIENVIDYGALYSHLLNMFSQYGGLETIRDEMGRYFRDFYINFFAFQLKADNILIYQYDDTDSLRGKRVVLYCAGKVGQDYYTQLSKYGEINIVAWADKHFENYKFDYREVVGVEKISSYDFDILLIAVSDEFIADEIRSGFVKNGIQEDKIVWKPPVRILAEYE